MRGLLLAVLLLAGCHEAPGARADAGPAALATPAALDAGWTLTPDRLEAWLRYQQALASLGPLERADVGRSAAVLARAHAEAAIRADAGLSELDVDQIEEVVAAVVAQRNIARLTGAEALREFEKATADLSDTQKAQAEKAIADLRAHSQVTAALAEEKARFGEETVKVVLTREPEVTRTWNALVEARGDRR